MAEAKDYRVTHFIAHIVDHTTQRFELSDLETPIGPGSGFPYEFFQSYIAHPFENPEHRRLATFRDRSTGVVARAMADLTADPGSFVAVSRTIARHLYDVMDAKEYTGPIRIAPGDVMVARFQIEREIAELGANAPGYLAVMKIHPTDTVIRHAEDQAGKRRVVFEETDEGVPAPTDDALQKIALVAPKTRDEPQPHDVVILDHQLAYKDVAAFFFSDFLESDLERDPTQDAGFVLGTIKKKLSRKPNVVTPPLTAEERIEIVSDSIAAMTATPKARLDDLIERSVKLPQRPQKDREKVRKMLVERFAKVPKTDQRLRSNQMVTVSPQAVAVLSEFRTYVLDYGVEIRGEARYLDTMLRFTRGANGQTVITITTQRFDVA